MHSKVNIRHVAAWALAAITCLHTAKAAALLPNEITVNRSTYLQQITMPAVSLQSVHIIPPVASGIYYNIRLQLNSSEGHVGLYCNPSWGGQPDTTSTIARPGNAVWETDNSSSDNLVISPNDLLYLPPNTVTSAILSGLAGSSGSYQPAFNCSAINPSSGNTAILTLLVTFDANNRTLSATDIEGVTSIYQSCCMGSSSCTVWKNRTQGFGNPLYTNFCQFQGQVCTPAGHLQKLDLTSYGLSCALPTASLVLFSSLEILVLSNNPGLLGSLPTMMRQLANLESLRHLELKQNAGIKGPLADSDPDTSAGLCTIILNGLRYLDFGSMQLTGSIPSCLLASPGTLAQLGLANNNLVAVIPDVIPDNSSLFSLNLGSNALTGSVPASIANATMLNDLELSNNRLGGSIPASLGDNMSLLSSVQLSNNALQGSLPSPLATSICVTNLDISFNQLSTLPQEWSDGFESAAQSSYQSIFIQQNELQSPFPEALSQFPQLVILNASSNHLSGTLPEAAGIFAETRVFDIGFNDMSGSIPAAFKSLGAVNKSLASVLVAPGVLLQRQVDLSHNAFIGKVPGFLARAAVPATVIVSLMGNTLSADCGNSSYTYLDICNSLLNGSSSTPAASPSAAPGVAPAAAPSAPALSSPAAALEASPASAPSSVSNQAANSGVIKSSNSGFGSGGIVGIVVAVAAIGVIAAVAILVLLKRRQHNPRILLSMHSSGGFSRFEDF